MPNVKKRRTKGSGSIKPRSDGRWEGSYTVGVDPGTGKQIRKSVYGKTKKEVDQKLRKITVAIDENRYTDSQRMPVGQWLDRWLENAVLNVKPGTYADYKRCVELHLKPLLGKVQICALRPDDVQKVIKDLNNSGLSAKTVKNILSCLHQALDYAVDNQLIPYNPAARRKLPKIVKKEIKPLDKPEQAQFLTAIAGDEYECLYTTALFTGMRSGELLGLMWKDVDFQHGTITICQQLRPPRLRGEKYTIDTTKNGKTRVITPAPSIMKMLLTHKNKQAALRCN